MHAKGKGALPLPAKAPPSHAMNVANYDGRENLAAGGFEERHSPQDLPGEGHVVGWRKQVNP